jgi:hypothetical protein
MAAILLLVEFLQLCPSGFARDAIGTDQDYIARLVHEKSISLDMGFYEMSDL